MEIVLLGLGTFAVFLMWTVVSLRMRRRNPGVGVIGGAIVLLLIGITIGFSAASTALRAVGNEDNGSHVMWSDMGLGVLIVIGILLVASGIGAWQGRWLKLSIPQAMLGGVAECIPAMVPLALLAGPSGHGPGPNSTIGLATLLLWILAELVAPLIVAKIPAGQRRYPRTFYVSPE